MNKRNLLFLKDIYCSYRYLYNLRGECIDVFSEIEKTIKNNGYESDLNVKISYQHNVSRKTQVLYLNGIIDSFNVYNDESIYELQFFSKN